MIYYDSAYYKGYTHIVCQDFVHQGVAFDNTFYVVLSDGCTSSPLTDIGARLLVLETCKIIDRFGWKSLEQPLFTIASNNAFDYVKRVKLTPLCLDATLFILIVNPDLEQYCIQGMGDGGFVCVQDTESFIKYINFEDNYPVYPYYLLSQMDPTFPFSNKKVMNEIDLLSLKSTKTVTDWNLEPAINEFGDLNSVKFLGIFSDGIDSFYKDQDKIEIGSIIKDLVKFKKIKSEFIKDKTLSYLDKQINQGIFHYDDFSFGGVYLDQ